MESARPGGAAQARLASSLAWHGWAGALTSTCSTWEAAAWELRGSVPELTPATWWRQECILDGKQYAALQEAGREKYEEDVEGCILLFNNQVRSAGLQGCECRPVRRAACWAPARHNRRSSTWVDPLTCEEVLDTHWSRSPGRHAHKIYIPGRYKTCTHATPCASFGPALPSSPCDCDLSHRLTCVPCAMSKPLLAPGRHAVRFTPDVGTLTRLRPRAEQAAAGARAARREAHP